MDDIEFIDEAIQNIALNTFKLKNAKGETFAIAVLQDLVKTITEQYHKENFEAFAKKHTTRANILDRLEKFSKPH